MKAKIGGAVVEIPADLLASSSPATSTPQARAAATPRRGANQLERDYADRLELLKRAGEVADWRFEPLALTLAPRTTYTPDFLVVLPSGLLEFHETKGGYVWDDARAKFKIAAALFPWFRFVWVTRVDGLWTLKPFDISTQDEP